MKAPGPPLPGVFLFLGVAHAPAIKLAIGKTAAHFCSTIFALGAIRKIQPWLSFALSLPARTL